MSSHSYNEDTMDAAIWGRPGEPDAAAQSDPGVRYGKGAGISPEARAILNIQGSRYSGLTAATRALVAGRTGGSDLLSRYDAAAARVAELETRIRATEEASAALDGVEPQLLADCVKHFAGFGDGTRLEDLDTRGKALVAALDERLARSREIRAECTACRVELYRCARVATEIGHEMIALIDP